MPKMSYFCNLSQNSLVCLIGFFLKNSGNTTGEIMSQKRVYETTIIINAALEDPDIEAVIAKVQGYIENHGGEILEVDKWGRRRLAYPINKKYNGFYVHYVYETMPNTIPILERFLVLEDTVLRHLTLILQEKVRKFRAQKSLEQGRPLSIGEDAVKKGNKRNHDRHDRRRHDDRHHESAERKEEKHSEPDSAETKPEETKPAQEQTADKANEVKTEKQHSEAPVESPEKITEETKDTTTETEKVEE